MRLRKPSSPGNALFVLCLLLICLTAKSNAQETVPLSAPAFQASPADIQAAAAKLTPERFADATVLYEETHYAFDLAGRVTERHRLVYRIETATGVESWSETSVEWEAFYQKEPRIRARVIQKDGRVVEFDPSTLTDVPANNEGGGDYSDDRVHKGPLPALAIGAIVEEETELTDREPLFAGGGIYRAYLQRSAVVEHARVVVEAPLELPLQYEISNLPDLNVRKEERGGIRRITFDQGHLPAAVRSDIELATSKPRLPLIQFSTGSSWQSVADAYRMLAEPSIRSDDVKTLLPSRQLNRMMTIQALVTRLHKDVRYTGIEFGQSRLQPQPPHEILKRHYGDCKDKAALLVAMLRASGIQASLALLNAGPGMDVSFQLPGMNQFDHAIVYIPGSSGDDPALWIDATANFNQVGTLPYADRGRRALIIAPGTTALTMTPEAKPEDDRLTETREFQLAEQGPASVIETSEGHGDIDASYRSLYGGTESKTVKADLESYAKNAYDSKSLTAVEHGEGTDLNQPFQLRLKMGAARRGFVGIDEATVVLFPSALPNRLPRWFSTEPKGSGQKISDNEQGEQEKAEKQRSMEYDLHPIITQWHYQISVPMGFVLRALPPDKTAQMGPATLSQEYSSNKAGMVTATLTFNSGKERYSTDEVLALRKAILALDKEDGVTINFDQVGAKLLADGKTREGLAADQALIDQHPKEAIHHVQIAYALLAAGVGDEARAEALKATSLEPKSPIAYSALGWILQFNSIGVHFGQGFDLAGSKAAYEKARVLEPGETSHTANLAILDEYDKQGMRYSSAADLDSAIAQYRALRQQDPGVADRYEDNLLYALFYARHFKELLSETGSLPGSIDRVALTVAATTSQNGTAGGLQRADQLVGNTEERGRVLQISGVELLRLGMYSQAADILAAGLQAGDQSSAGARQVELLRNLRPAEVLPQTDPRFPVQQLLNASFNGKLDGDAISHLLARHPFGSESEWNQNMKKTEIALGSLQVVANRANMPPKVLADIALGTLKISSQGSSNSGYRITSQTIGAVPQHYFVLSEDGRFKIAASTTDFTEVGTEALYLLAHGDEPEARSLLDWKREELHRGGGDDPLTGPLMPRFWTAGESQGATSIRLAAASLLTTNERIKELLPEIAARRGSPALAADKAGQTDLDLLLTHGYLRIQDGPHARDSSQKLLHAYPDSIVALRLSGAAYRLTGEFAAWKTMLSSRLARHPGSRDLLLLAAEESDAEGDFSQARVDLHTVIENGNALSQDYNFYAWLALFTNKISSDDLEAGHQANELTKNTSFNELHTLACLYAAEGKSTQARQLMIQAMEAANLAAPNSAAWYLFGSVYQQYGIRDAAIAAYHRVEKPTGIISPTDTWVLTQRQLKLLNAN